MPNTEVRTGPRPLDGLLTGETDEVDEACGAHHTRDADDGAVPPGVVPPSVAHPSIAPPSVAPPSTAPEVSDRLRRQLRDMALRSWL